MKKHVLIVTGVAMLLTFCKNENTGNFSNSNSPKLRPYFQQLFITQEASKPDGCGAGESIESGLNGCMYFTKKGNVIVQLSDEGQDTMSYYWGTYTINDSTITYRLTNEYYYAGKWDARWDVKDPDYKKGKTRKVSRKDVTIYKTRCDSDSYYRPYSAEEIKMAEMRVKNQTAGSLYYMPYYGENKDMKFYSWLFTQVPVLAKL